MAHKKVNLQRIANDKTRITTYNKRKANIYKKADEFTTLCDVETCLIVYGPTKGNDEVVAEPEIWPRDETKVREIIRKYRDTMSNRCRKEVNVETFVNDLGKAKVMESNKRVKSNHHYKYCSWEEKLNNCSQDQLLGILYAVNNKLHDAMRRKDHNMIRAHHQAMETPIHVDQHYMPQFQEQPQFQSLMFPYNYNNMGFSFISPHENQNQIMDQNPMENWNEYFSLTQGLMMSKGSDGSEFSQRQSQHYYTHEPVVQRSADIRGDQFAGCDVPLGVPWRLSGNQVEEWELLEKNRI